MRKEILLCGFGGQGLILAGILLAEAAVVYEGKNATHNQSYGIEARGGDCKSEVIISDDEVHFAEIDNPDILLAMSQSSFDKFISSVKDDALIIVDSVYVKDLSAVKNHKNIYQIPITDIARGKAGKEILANVVALGAISKLTDVVKVESLEKVISERVPEGTEEINKRALYEGYKSTDNQ